MLSVWPALGGAAWPRALDRSLLAKRGCGGCLRHWEIWEICPEPGEFWHWAGPEGWAAESSQAGTASSCCQQGNSAREQRSSPDRHRSGWGAGHAVLHHCKFNGSETALNTSSLCCRLPGVSLDPATLRTCHCMEMLSILPLLSFFDFMTKLMIFTVSFFFFFLKSYCINNWTFILR